MKRLQPWGLCSHNTYQGNTTGNYQISLGRQVIHIKIQIIKSHSIPLNLNTTFLPMLNLPNKPPNVNIFIFIRPQGAAIDNPVFEDVMKDLTNELLMITFRRQLYSWGILQAYTYKPAKNITDIIKLISIKHG